VPPPRKTHVLDQAQFDRLLAWLDEERETAGRRYEQIRTRLITIFAARGCGSPEELADETIDRVARRVSDIAEDYVGDQARYFFGVANNVHHEYLKRPPQPELELDHTKSDNEPDKEKIHQCLERCLAKFSGAERQMILHYYSQQKKAKVDLHRQMAEELGVSINTLRLRVLRMKEKLQPCLTRCLERADIF
jgi:DNA-directed RNA polymerase specialized sigma24 family protein